VGGWGGYVQLRAATEGGRELRGANTRQENILQSPTGLIEVEVEFKGKEKSWQLFSFKSPKEEFQRGKGQEEEKICTPRRNGPSLQGTDSI